MLDIMQRIMEGIRTDMISTLSMLTFWGRPSNSKQKHQMQNQICNHHKATGNAWFREGK